MKYIKISRKILERHFSITPSEGMFKLRSFCGENTIKIKIPFVLDEQAATLVGMMPDGSLIKDLRRIYFTQQKDMSKIYLFKDLLQKIFSQSNKIFIRKGKGAFETYTNSKTLAHFIYYVLDVKKSDEETRIPELVFVSPLSVKCAYLRAAFDMEAYVSNRLNEIRFITIDKNYAEDLKKILSSLHVDSIVKPRIGGTHRTIQYRISIYGKQNFKKFSKIGFSIPLHKGRFQQALARYDV